jgi:hypothetical protein
MEKKMTYEEIESAHYTTLMALSEEDVYDVVTTVIEHYRKVGFPYFEIDKKRIKKEYEILLKNDVSKTELPNNELQQSMWGLSVCNMFHPEMYATRCNDSKCPMDIFLDDKLFRVAITKRIKYNDRVLNHSCIRRTLSAFGGQAASNFRPSIAKWMYQKYCPLGGDVLDPCAGYGGRLMGAFCSHVGSYTSTDPNIATYEGNMRLYTHLVEAAGENRYPETTFYNTPFEDFHTTAKFDLVFTSPPYYNTEKYSDADTQSYMRYPEYTQWVKGFLEPLIVNSFAFLKPDGYLALNVGRPIDEDTLKIGTRVFGKAPDVYHMRLSKFLGSGNKGSVSHKTEPVFIWRKD